MKKALLYDPYLDVLGGGERHVLSIMEVLKEHGYDIDVAWDNPKILEELKTHLKLTLDGFNRVPNVFKTHSTKERSNLTRSYDIFLYVTDGSYFISYAKKNYIFSMYPDRSLYKLSLLNWLKTRKYQVIANGDFTAERIMNWMKLKTHVLYPYIEDTHLESTKRSKKIISVGRIFNHLHSKRHDIIIKAFIAFKQKYPECSDFTLEILGGLKDEDSDYFNELKERAQDRKDISFHPNVSHADLKKSYSTALFYWHAGGFGIDENVHPENVEHVGITPLEAMAAGCITFCYKAGGPKLYIHEGVNGYLYSSIEELIDKTYQSYRNPQSHGEVVKNAHTYISQHFTRKVFKDSVKRIFNI